MVLVKFTHSGGTEIYLNSALVRLVQPQAQKGCRLIFDPSHEIFVKEDIEQVLRLLDRIE